IGRDPWLRRLSRMPSFRDTPLYSSFAKPTGVGNRADELKNTLPDGNILDLHIREEEEESVVADVAEDVHHGFGLCPSGVPIRGTNRSAALVEVDDGNAQNSGGVKQSASCDPVHSMFVFLDLLE